MERTLKICSADTSYGEDADAAVLILRTKRTLMLCSADTSDGEDAGASVLIRIRLMIQFSATAAVDLINAQPSALVWSSILVVPVTITDNAADACLSVSIT